MHIRQVFLWRIVAQVVAGRWKLGSGDMQWVRLLGLFVLPKIEVNLLLLLRFPLALRRRLIRQNSAFANGTDQLHDLLGLVLGREEASLGLGGAAEGCSESTNSPKKRLTLLLTHLLLNGGEILDGIGVRVLDFVREKTHLNAANELQLILTAIWSERFSGGIGNVGVTYVRLRGLPVLTSVNPVHPLGTSILSRRLWSASPVAGRMIFLPLMS